MDRGAWRGPICGVAKSWTWLSIYLNNKKKNESLVISNIC